MSLSQSFPNVDQCPHANLTGGQILDHLWALEKSLVEMLGIIDSKAANLDEIGGQCIGAVDLQYRNLLQDIEELIESPRDLLSLKPTVFEAIDRFEKEIMEFQELLENHLSDPVPAME
ncbi:MAG: hypothetical protein ACLFR0_03265 [Alphaproteobacteria bacterium]